MLYACSGWSTGELHDIGKHAFTPFMMLSSAQARAQRKNCERGKVCSDDVHGTVLLYAIIYPFCLCYCDGDAIFGKYSIRADWSVVCVDVCVVSIVMEYATEG